MGQGIGVIPVIDEPGLSEVLVAMSESLRILNEAQAVLLNEVGALREALKEIGGERFASVFQKYQLDMMARNLKVEELQGILARIQILAAKTVVIPESD